MLGVAESEQAQATLTTTDPDPPRPHVALQDLTRALCVALQDLTRALCGDVVEPAASSMRRGLAMLPA
jgi:hypothetical protein